MTINTYFFAIRTPNGSCMNVSVQANSYYAGEQMVKAQYGAQNFIGMVSCTVGPEMG